MAKRVQVDRMRPSPVSTTTARPVDTYVGREQVGKTKTAQLMEALGVGVKTAAKSIEDYDEQELINKQAKARSFFELNKEKLSEVLASNPNLTNEEAISELGPEALEEYNGLTEGFALDTTKNLFTGHLANSMGTNLDIMRQNGLQLQRTKTLADNYGSVMSDIGFNADNAGIKLPSQLDAFWQKNLPGAIAQLEAGFKAKGLKPADFKDAMLQQAQLEAAKGNPYLAQYIVDKGLYDPDTRVSMQNLATNAKNNMISKQRLEYAEEISALRNTVTGKNAKKLDATQKAQLDTFLEEGIISLDLHGSLTVAGENAEESRAFEAKKLALKAQEEAQGEAQENLGFALLDQADQLLNSDQSLTPELLVRLETARDNGLISNEQRRAVLKRHYEAVTKNNNLETARKELEEQSRLEQRIGRLDVVIEEIGQPQPDEDIEAIFQLALESEDASLISSAEALMKANFKAKVNLEKANTLGPILAQGQLTDPAIGGEYTSEQIQMGLRAAYDTYVAGTQNPRDALIKTAKLAARNGTKFDFITDSFKQAMTFGITDIDNPDAINSARQAVELYRDMRFQGVAKDYFKGLTPELQKIKTMETIMAHTNSTTAEAMAMIADIESKSAEEVFNDRWAVITKSREDALTMLKDKTDGTNVDFLMEPMSRMYSLYMSTGRFDHETALEKAADAIADDFTEVDGIVYPSGSQSAIAFAETGGDGIYEFFTAKVEEGQLTQETVDVIMEDYNYDDLYFQPADTLGSAYVLYERETGMPVTGMSGFVVDQSTLGPLSVIAERKNTFSRRAVEFIMDTAEDIVNPIGRAVDTVLD